MIKFLWGKIKKYNTYIAIVLGMSMIAGVSPYLVLGLLALYFGADKLIEYFL